MITGDINQFYARCRERGVDIEAASECIVQADGDVITVDELHPAYPRRPAWPREVYHRPPPAEWRGPGTELKKLLAGFPFFIKTTPTCACNRRARAMDARERAEPGWCEKNLDTIVGWLQEEHTKRKVAVPFSAFAAKQLVKLAIRRARRGNSQ